MFKLVCVSELLNNAFSKLYQYINISLPAWNQYQVKHII
mgnify:CR=1 FL=1